MRLSVGYAGTGSDLITAAKYVLHIVQPVPLVC